MCYITPPSHCCEFCLRTNTNWHSLRIAQHHIDSNYIVLVCCHFRISSQADTNVLKCSKHSYWPCESKPIRIASYCIDKCCMHLCQFLLVRISSSFVLIRCTFALGFAACLLWLSTLQYDAQRSHCRIGSHMFALVSHHIITQSYLFSITTILLHIASCRHRIASYCISLHHINSCLIRVWFALIRK